MIRAPRWSSRLMVGIDGPDPRVVGDLAVRERDVEIDPHEDPFAGDVRVADGLLVHGRSDRDGQSRGDEARSGRRPGSCSPTRCRTRR